MVRKQETLVLVPAVAAAVGAVWVTLDADFLRYPGWLSVQKADLILGPVLVGLYWRRVRPASRFGWLLIAYGFLCAGYITQSFDNSWLFGIGLDWESLIFLGNLLLILTFPTGRLDRPAAKLVFLGGVAAAALNVVLVMMLPQTSAGGAISGCRELCPKNALALTPDVSLALDLIKPFQIVVVVVVFATIALLFWRIATGTPPQRRAVAIGTSFALLFLVLQAAYLLLSLFDVDVPRLQNWIQWAYTGARAAVWYGFLFALIAARLFAARALRRLVRGSLRRPSQRELEAMLRGPLGDRASSFASGTNRPANGTARCSRARGAPSPLSSVAPGLRWHSRCPPERRPGATAGRRRRRPAGGRERRARCRLAQRARRLASISGADHTIDRRRAPPSRPRSPRRRPAAAERHPPEARLGRRAGSRPGVEGPIAGARRRCAGRDRRGAVGLAGAVSPPSRGTRPRHRPRAGDRAGAGAAQRDRTIRARGRGCRLLRLPRSRSERDETCRRRREGHRDAAG